MQYTSCQDRALEAMITRAWNAEKKGELTRAESLVMRILQDFPGQPKARFVQARVWARTGRLENARQSLQQLVDEDPTFDAARLALIGTLFLVCAYSEGLYHLQYMIAQCAKNEDQSPETKAVMASLWASYKSRTFEYQAVASELEYFRTNS